MEDLQLKVNELEAKILDNEEAVSDKTLQDLLNNVNILESLAFLHKSDQFVEKISNLKDKIKLKSNSKIYDSVDRKNRIKIIGKGMQKVLQMNEFIHESVNDQAYDLDIIEMATDQTLNNIEQANSQLITQQMYLERKNRFIKRIIYLMLFFISLLVLRILI